ncbi:MAG: extracellular solute-binding protein [Candidatus Vecturithrix sp.]|nr:extracellular solute-binding protein [Candidatus Vecturithrix sp.]
MFKKSGTIMCLLSLIVSLILFSPINVKAADQVELRLMVVWGAEQAEYIKKMLAEFTETHPNIKVNLEIVAGGGAGPYQEALQTGMAAGTGPDVFFEWGGELAGYFIDAGHCEPLDAYYEKYGWDEIVIDWAKKAISRNGKVYGFPVSTHGMTFWYRVDLWNKLGLSEPTTYEEVEKICETAKAQGIYPLSVAGKYGWMLMRLVDYLLEVTCGPELHDQLNALEVSWDRPEVVDAYKLYKKWIDNEWIVPGFLAVNPDDARMPVYQGAALMVFEGSWMETTFKNDGQDPYNFDFFIHPTGHTPTRISGFPEQFMINASSKHKEEAGIFLNWFIQPELHSRYWGTGMASTGSKGVSINEKELPRTAKWRSMLDQLQAVYPPTDQAFQAELLHVLFEVQDAIALGELTPEQAAKKMQEAAEAWKAKQQ